MSEEIIPTPLRNAAYQVAEHAGWIIRVIERECLEMPVTFKLGPDEVEVRTAYKPQEGWIVTTKLGPRDGGSK